MTRYEAASDRTRRIEHLVSNTSHSRQGALAATGRVDVIKQLINGYKARVLDACVLVLAACLLGGCATLEPDPALANQQYRLQRIQL